MSGTINKKGDSGGPGKWIPAACWHNCGGRCLLKAYVVNGKVLRVKTDDTHPDSLDYPQLRACARGRAQIGQVFGEDRLKYPMKRKHWSPGGGNKELRGRDEWVRITWDEALDSVALETRRIIDEHGNRSLLMLSWEELFSDPVPRVFSRLGGFIKQWGTVSLGGWPLPSLYMTGVMWDANDRKDLLNSKVIVLWGNNPIVNRHGNTAYFILEAKRAGAKVIVVDPMCHESAKVLADEWIPVRPGADTALLLGIAYHIITNNLHDQDFLDRCTIGFDAAHMPEGADPKKNFKDYVLGNSDGVPKTPDWASAHCGTEPEVIKRFAELVAGTKPVSFISALGVARTNHGEQFAQALFTLAWMTGNIGVPGGQVTSLGTPHGGPPLVLAGRDGSFPVENPFFPLSSSILFGLLPNPHDTNWTALNWSECWEAILSGEYTAGVRGKQPIDIRMIYHGYAAMLNQMPDINKGIAAHRKVEFVVSASQFLDTNAKYADIVLPVTTMWEREDAVKATYPYDTGTILSWQNIIDPLYEAKDDMFIARELAKRLGIDPDEIEGPPKPQRLYNQIAGSMVMKEDGTGYEPLFTITAEDIKQMGAEGNPQSGGITYQEFKEKGIYQTPRKIGDHFGHIAFKEFRDDPISNPVATRSGKLEIYCETLADMVNAFGWSKLSPIATYEQAVDIEDDDGGNYPFILISPHYLRRAHSTMDNVPYLREAFPQECWINNIDAEKQGIKNNDTVMILNPHGKVIRRAKVTPCIIPGTIALGNGAWVDKDEETGIDKAGAANTVQAPKPRGQGFQAWNSARVQLKKYDQPLEPDHVWPQRIVS